MSPILSSHPGGANAAFADGSVRFVRAGIDIRLLARLVTRAGGEVVSHGDYGPQVPIATRQRPSLGVRSARRGGARSRTADRFFEEIRTTLFRFLLRAASRGQQAATRGHALRGPARQRPRARLSIESLESRALPSTFVVDRLSDLGEGTGLTGDLRYCITQANSLPGDDTITFAVTGTIRLAGALPSLSSTIDLQGPGADLLTLRGDSIQVSSSAIALLSGLTVSGGGGISNRGTLPLAYGRAGYDHFFPGGSSRHLRCALGSSGRARNASSEGRRHPIPWGLRSIHENTGRTGKS